MFARRFFYLPPFRLFFIFILWWHFAVVATRSKAKLATFAAEQKSDKPQSAVESATERSDAIAAYASRRLTTATCLRAHYDRPAVGEGSAAVYCHCQRLSTKVVSLPAKRKQRAFNALVVRVVERQQHTTPQRSHRPSRPPTAS